MRRTDWPISTDVAFAWPIPFACVGCQRLLTAPQPYCPACTREIAFLPAELARTDPDLVAVLSYDGIVAQTLARLKFRGQLSAARTLGQLLASAPRTQFSVFESDWVVPVPLHPMREWARGFNQCERILHFAALQRARSKLPLPRLAHNLLRRDRATPPQRDLRADARKTNVERAFSVNRWLEREIPRSSRIVVFDDVVTTGATLRSSIQALRSAGYRNCRGVALMRTLT